MDGAPGNSEVGASVGGIIGGGGGNGGGTGMPGMPGTWPAGGSWYR